MTGEPHRYVIHVPIVAPDLPRARVLARTAARALTFLAVDVHGTTVSEEDGDGIGEHHRVFCDRLLDNGRRCVLRAEHQTACAPRVPR